MLRLSVYYTDAIQSDAQMESIAPAARTKILFR